MVTAERLDLYRHLLLDAVLAVLTASQDVMNLYQEGAVGVRLKSDLTPLSPADQCSHATICQILSRNHIPVFSEEGRQYEYVERKDWEMYWLVDPLDGTQDFLNMTGDFTVNVALIVDGRPVLGVIDAPASHALYFNIPGDGSYRIVESHRLLESCGGELTEDLLRAKGQRLPLKSLDKAEGLKRLRVVRSRFNMSSRMESYFNELRKDYDLQIEIVGSSLKFCQIAEGSVDLYPRLFTTREWDTAAGQAILEGVGMLVGDFSKAESNSASSAVTNAGALSQSKGSFTSSMLTPLRYNKERVDNPSFVACRPRLKLPKFP